LEIKKIEKKISNIAVHIFIAYPSMTDHVYKICVLGDIKTGKTSFVKRVVHDIFSIHYRATIGVDFFLKVKRIGNDSFRLQLWDLSGSIIHENKTEKYYRESVGAFILIDHASPKTIESAKEWKRDIDSKVIWPYSSEINPVGESVARIFFSPVILLVNKIDLLDDEIRSAIDYDNFCKEYGFHSWIAISAKDSIGTELACNTMFDICKNITIPVQMTSPTIKEPESPSEDASGEANKFITSIFTMYKEKRNTTDKKFIEVMKILYMTLYFDSETKSFRDEIKTNRELSNVVNSIHDILVDESTDDSTKVTKILNFMINYGRTCCI